MFLQKLEMNSMRSKVNVYGILKNAIQFLELKPGFTINEAELSEKLGISRTPIREALLRLSDDLLIDIYPQRGTYVSKINLDLVHELTYMRHVLETDILLALCRSQTNISDYVDDKLSLMRLALKKQDTVGYLEQDEAYHQALFAINGHEVTWNIISNTRAHSIRVLVLDLMLPNRLEESYQEHLKIINCIENGDQESLSAVLDSHHDFMQLKNEEQLRQIYQNYFK